MLLQPISKHNLRIDDNNELNNARQMSVKEERTRNVGIEIGLTKISNMMSTGSNCVKFEVKFMHEILLTTENIPVNSDEMMLDLSCSLNFPQLTMQIYQELLDNPLLVLMHDASVSDKAKQVTPKKSVKSATLSSKSQLFKTRLIGVCNVDLLPLFLEGREELLLQRLLESDEESHALGKSMTSWPNLPQLELRLKYNQAVGKDVISNMVELTVESIYNPVSSMSDHVYVNTTMVLPIDSIEDRDVMLSKGVRVHKKDTECGKRWASLSHVTGRGKLSDERISRDPTEILNYVETTQLNFEKYFEEDVERVEWNQFTRHAITQNGVEKFNKQISKYRLWPLEVKVESRASVKRSKMSITSKSSKYKEIQSGSEKFNVFLNLSTLLFPGVKRVRQACQLYSYSTADILKYSGSDKNTSRRKLSHVEMEEDKPGEALFTENGEPVFIIVEIRLHRPINKKKCLEDASDKIFENVFKKPEIDPRTQSADTAVRQFAETIQEMSVIMRREHDKYKAKEEEESFLSYLSHTGLLNNLKTMLQDKVVAMIHHKYGNRVQPKEVLSEVYVYLVEEMYKITNECPSSVGKQKTYHAAETNLQLFAEEAFEEDEYYKAKEHILQKIASDKMDALPWIDYAVLLLGLDEIDKSIEAVREALCWDSTNKYGLVVYGILLARVEDFTTAEMIFELLNNKYPEFVEGWMISYIFYIKTERREGADVMLQMAKKTSLSQKPDQTSSVDNQIISLSWDKHLSMDDLHIRTAVVLLQYKCYEFAELCLSQLILQDCNTRHSLAYLYFQSVVHYFTKRYKEAVLLLDEAIREHDNDLSLWSLLGHCFHKLGKVSEAIACYEFVIQSSNKPNDIHLVYVRMSEYFMKVQKYKCSKQLLVQVCKSSPTPRNYLNLGISCYYLLEYDEAESALKKATLLDPYCPVTWGYLSLVHIQRYRKYEFEDCFNMVKQNGLDVKELIEEIQVLAKYNGLM